MIAHSKVHLLNVSEGYFEHQRVAFRYGATCIIAGVMALIHGCVPAWFETSASDRVVRLASLRKANM